MKKLLAIVVMGIFTVGAYVAPVWAEDVKIGIIDVKRAIESTKDGKKVEGQLKKEMEKRQSSLDSLSKDIKEMNEDLQKKAMVLSDDVRLKKQQDIQGKMVNYQKELEKNTMEMRKKESELVSPILEKLQKVVEKMATDGKYTVILQKTDQGPNAVVWAKKEVDITDDVVKAYEKMK